MALIAPHASILEAGVDEAGRGPLVGAVVAAAVILPADFADSRLKDSKKMNEAMRIELEEIIKFRAIAWAIGEASHTEIDSINILQATYLAMNRAIDGLTITPRRLLIDGNRFQTECGIEYQTIVGGDNKFMSIAAASVLAKNHRDRLLCDLHTQYPHYGWDSNKGYPTEAHRKAIAVHGLSPYHRRSFKVQDLKK